MTRSIRRHYAASGATHDVDLTLAKGRLEGHVEGRAVWADVRILRSFPGGANLVVSHDAGRARAVVVRDGNTVHVALRGRVHRLTVAAARQEADAAVAAGTELFVASPMTGVVRKVAAEAGRAYAAGDTLVVVEAMKMEFAVEAPRAVTVDEVRAKPGDRVEIGQVLVTFAADGDVNEEFTFDVKVRFADVDHARVVYYPRFFHYFHVAFEEMFEQGFGMTYPNVIDGEHVGFPSVKTEAEYRSPARFGDVLKIHITCARLGSRSVTLRYRAYRQKDGVLCTEAMVTTACVDMRTFTSQVIPDRYREFFSRFLEG